MKFYYYDKYINKNTKGRYDVTPVFTHPEVFQNLILDMLLLHKDTKYTVIVGTDALGFILAGAMAFTKKVGFVAVRKAGKLPGKKGTVRTVHFTDYSGKKKALEVNKGMLKKSDRVLIVDEWIETGTQAKACIQLIEEEGAKVAGVCALCVDKNKNTQILFDKYNCKSIRV